MGDIDSAFNENTTKKSSSLLTCAFNQDGGCLAIGTTAGFSVHNLHPQYAVSVDRELTGGVGVVEMLFRCNLMVLVGGGPSPVAPPHRVLIHDDHVNRPIGELSFRQVVLAARLRKDAIAVALRDRVYVYHLADLSLRDKIYTADNPHGLLCLSTQIQDMVLVCPSVTNGHVRVELYGSRKTVVRLIFGMKVHCTSNHGISPFFSFNIFLFGIVIVNGSARKSATRFSIDCGRDKGRNRVRKGYGDSGVGRCDSLMLTRISSWS